MAEPPGSLAEQADAGDVGAALPWRQAVEAGGELGRHVGHRAGPDQRAPTMARRWRGRSEGFWGRPRRRGRSAGRGTARIGPG
ncbi:hypothetical protein [Rhodopila globiformis]|uniref:hypothetical protein n=1 Tax=Rhodopila globiformis TaxID=1071 RepID=UPI0011B06A47|nr:hypothetical protein [Rhodopila globiformis]